ncbi:MAG: ferritin family protein [Clostridiales bacterium]|nr:ferritin family protein [Clostridiales bacterium]
MDILKFAMEFEAKSYQYYMDMAAVVEIDELKKLFIALAQDEKNHIQILKELSESTKITFESNHLIDSIHAFNELISKEINSKNLSKLKALKVAFDFEDESMKFYKEKSETAEKISERLIFLRLYFEEKKHREILNDLIEFNTYIETSLETAEFQK